MDLFGGQREVIFLHVGKAGIQSGIESWELLRTEHEIFEDGTKNDENPELEGDEKFRNMFFRTNQGSFQPRALFLDTDNEIIENIRISSSRNFFPSPLSVSGKEDTGGNFARGFCSKGKELLDESTNVIRKLSENCDKLDGFFLLHGTGGGTGSGLGSLLIERLSTLYPKKIKSGISIFPSSKTSNSSIDTYNEVHSTHSLIEHLDFDYMFGNDSLRRKCIRNLDVENPTVKDMNQIISQCVSSITSGLRYDSALNSDLTEMMTNSVPYPRIHMLINSLSPLISVERAIFEPITTVEITNDCFRAETFLLDRTIDPRKGKYMACILQYCGDFVPKDISSAVGLIKTKRDIVFVDWSPTGFKCGINYRNPPHKRSFDGGLICRYMRSLCLTANTTCIDVFFEEMKNRFDLMFKKKAFIHWFLREGMEEKQMVDAREDVEMYCSDLAECGAETEYLSGEEEEEEDLGLLDIVQDFGLLKKKIQLFQFMDLPSEIQIEIISFLDSFRDLPKFFCLNKSMNEFMNKETTLRGILLSKIDFHQRDRLSEYHSIVELKTLLLKEVFLELAEVNVKPLDSEKTPESCPVKVLYKFVAEDEEELEVDNNEFVSVLEQHDEWVLCRNNDGDEGYVPACYLEISKYRHDNMKEKEDKDLEKKLAKDIMDQLKEKRKEGSLSCYDVCVEFLVQYALKAYPSINIYGRLL